eukprot:4006425-Amphidinium_carterae.1
MAIEYTADKRHVTLLQTQLGFTPSSKPLSSPGASVTVDAESGLPLEEDLLVFQVSSDAVGLLGT